VGVLIFLINSAGKKHWSKEHVRKWRELGSIYIQPDVNSSKIMSNYLCWILLCNAVLGQNFSNILGKYSEKLTQRKHLCWCHPSQKEKKRPDIDC
jgi:hypothetical protein